MNLSIIIRYFEELEEEFKVFTDLTFNEFSKDKHLDNVELSEFIIMYNIYPYLDNAGFTLKNKIYYLYQMYESMDNEVAIQIIIEVLEKYYE